MEEKCLGTIGTEYPKSYPEMHLFEFLILIFSANVDGNLNFRN